MPAAPTASKSVLSAAAPFRSSGGAAGLPQRVRILGWGENLGRTTGARILVDGESAALSGIQQLVARERVPLDYEHQSVKGHPNYQPDPRHSPGSGVIEVVDGEGIFLSAIEYTPNGLEHAPSYQDVSAVVHLDKAGRPLWISSVALTQAGDVDGMEFSEAVAALAAKQSPPISKKPETKTNTTMDETKFRALLLKLLGLPDDAADEAIVAAVEKKSDAPAAPDAAALSAATAAVTALSARIGLLEQGREGDERQRLVDAATLAGKVIPLSAELVKLTPVAVLSGLIEALTPGEVPQAGKTAAEKAAENVAVLSADEKDICKQLGLTPEQYAKGKPVTA